MFVLIVIVAVMAVLYGLAWHNEPAKAHQDRPRPNRDP
jgi:hypothetical protein